MALVVKDLPTNAGDIRDTGLIPGSGRSVGGEGEGTATHSSIHAWRIPWTEPGRLQSIGSQKSDTTEATWHICTPTAGSIKPDPLLFNSRTQLVSP